MSQIHKTAIVDPEAKLGEGVVIGPYAIIGPDVTLGDNVEIGPHAVVDGWTDIGRGAHIFPGAMIGQVTQDLKFKGEKTHISIGEETTIREYVTINGGTGENSETIIGKKCLLMAYSHVAHNCIVGDRVIVANCGTLAGHVEVESGAIIGGLVAVHQFCRVGSMCIVGGCTKVVQDCPPFFMIDGHPARARGINSIGLRRNKVSSATASKLKKAYKVLYRSGYAVGHALEEIRSQICDGDEQVEHLIEFIASSKRGIC